MLSAYMNCLKIPELKKRLLFTFGIIILCRIACTIPCPGIDPAALSEMFKQMNSNKGIRYAALAYSGAIYIPMTNNAVTAVGSSYADDVSSHKMSIIKRHNDTGLPGYNPDPVPDPEEPESPIGDVVWPLMVLLAGVYSYVIYRRKKTTNPCV